MCYGSGCYFEIVNGPNWGECGKRGRFPKNWICPPDRGECEQCGKIVEDNKLDDGLCSDCQDDDR